MFNTPSALTINTDLTDPGEVEDEAAEAATERAHSFRLYDID